MRGRRMPVDAWVFDLDNTLYPPGLGIVERIDARMTAFIMRTLGLGRAEADRLRRAYWREYGATLTGLVARHGVDPAEFLAEVHAIDLAPLAPDPALARRIGALPGRRIVFTNGARRHAERVLDARGLAGVFDGIIAIDDRAFAAKPKPEACAALVRLAGIDPRRTVILDDDATCLRAPKALGMTTVWVAQRARKGAPPWVDRAAASVEEALAPPE